MELYWFSFWYSFTSALNDYKLSIHFLIKSLVDHIGHIVWESTYLYYSLKIMDDF